ncbi:MAG TPA: phosphate signaling complex protein PhoU [Acidobacteriota bacterium]|nr:phosphate signaling complex protein PhoU [Acidobacteriota bacterium]HOS99669.1 phosphate signaling complex protein PhoU [Acidobacteriota bacterium]HQF88349.1 phosphate signaling complex protein PhoU [Acidobacteriota bacterium]HQG93055.1 phosphate signaling complex protein PhoU [Acidobacteriota bacterium]HQK89255.1 phosphate signaling complex protein PhoU [Acidobacteriota bacterium]
MLAEKIMEMRERLMEQANLAEEMIDQSIRGLEEQDGRLLRELLTVSEARLNELEIEIGEQCATIIALHEPRAKDLRLVLLALRMATDLERIGDHAVNIAQSALFLIERPPVKPLVDIPNMAAETRAMLRDSITSFIREDAALAEGILTRDDRIDEYRDQIHRELITYMVSDATTIERALHLMRVTANLERAADLSTNIAENVIYLVQGRVVKHGHRDEP